MTAMYNELPSLQVGGPAHDAAYDSVTGKQWTEAVLALPPVANDILMGNTNDGLSTKAPARLMAGLDEQLGELSPPMEHTYHSIFGSVDVRLIQREHFLRMMRLCNVAGAIGAIRMAEGVEMSVGEQSSLQNLEHLTNAYHHAHSLTY